MRRKFTQSLSATLLTVAVLAPMTAGVSAASSQGLEGLDQIVAAPMAAEPGGAEVRPGLTRLDGAIVRIDTSDPGCVPVVSTVAAVPKYCVEMTRLSSGEGALPAGSGGGADSSAASPADSGESTTAAAADDNGGWPDVCRTTTTENTGGAYQAVDRRNACMHEQFFIVVRETRTGAITGTAQLEGVIKMQSSRTTSRWVYTIDVAISFATGNGAPTMSTGRLVACPIDCSIAIAGTYEKNGIDSWHGAGQVDVPVQDIKEDVAPGSWQLVFTNPSWVNVARAQFGSPYTRCDNVIGNRPPGCVFDQVAGLMGYSQLEFPNFTQHISRAQNSGLPGGYGSGTYLTYLTSETERTRNGRKACPDSLSRPTGKTCDEYPFRSTHEGAATSPYAGQAAHQARTFDGCQMPSGELGRTGRAGWSHCFIPGGENSTAGTRLGAFYSDERLLEDDRFQVGYLP